MIVRLRMRDLAETLADWEGRTIGVSEFYEFHDALTRYAVHYTDGAYFRETACGLHTVAWLTKSEHKFSWTIHVNLESKP